MNCFYNVIIVIAITSLIFFGCSTIISGTKQDIHVTTDPAGATVYDGNTTSQTPVTLNLERKEDHTITISKPRYEIEKITLHRKLNPVVAGNVVMIGGVVFMAIDASSGAMWDLYPDTLDIYLKSPEKPWYKDLSLNFRDLYVYDEDSVGNEEYDQDAMIDITSYFIRENKKLSNI